MRIYCLPCVMSETGSKPEKSTSPSGSASRSGANPSHNPAGDPSRGPARCPFCAPSAPKIIEQRLAYAIPDAYPVSDGHALVIPRRHVADYFRMHPEEKSACWELVEWVRQYLLDRYQPTGINVGFNCGRSAGQTIYHAHIHVIPRYDGDTLNPRGGVRHCIPGKGDY